MFRGCGAPKGVYDNPANTPGRQNHDSGLPFFIQTYYMRCTLKIQLAAW